MSQIFNLQLATDTLKLDAQKLNISPEQLCQIRVKVEATLLLRPDLQLLLHYQIQLPSSTLAKQLDWRTWRQAQVGFTDYLWEQTCLECFISSQALDDENKNRYIEINASPSGQYALYQFDNYRTPSTLPPMPLLKSMPLLKVDAATRAHINWSSSLSNPVEEKINRLSPVFNSINNPANLLPANLLAGTFTAYPVYQRSFSISLTELPTSFWSDSLPADIDKGIKQLHPCVILRFGNTHLYFAPIHASPPDFHQRRYWSHFDYQAALSQ